MECTIQVGDNIYAFPNTQHFHGTRDRARVDVMTTGKIQKGTAPTNKHLVTFSSVPIRIEYGSFVLVENELEYFKLTNNQLNTLSRLFTNRGDVVHTLLSHDEALSNPMPLKETIPSRLHLEITF